MSVQCHVQLLLPRLTNVHDVQCCRAVMAAAAAEQQPTTCESWNDVRLCLVENYGNGLFDAMPITFKGVTFTWTRSAINYRIGGGPVSLLCTKSAMVLEDRVGRDLRRCVTWTVENARFSLTAGSQLRRRRMRWARASARHSTR